MWEKKRVLRKVDHSEQRVSQIKSSLFQKRGVLEIKEQILSEGGETVSTKKIIDDDHEMVKFLSDIT
jgi:hypothetical protein